MALESYRLAAQKDCGILLSGRVRKYYHILSEVFRSLFLTLLHQGKNQRTGAGRSMSTAENTAGAASGSGGIFSRRKPVGIMKRCPGICMTKVPCGRSEKYEVKAVSGHRVVPRDPTRDKRLIALVLSLPAEQFTHAGQERRLVRQYLQGKIPEEILADGIPKGKTGRGK